jgi:hypothetical protein
MSEFTEASAEASPSQAEFHRRHQRARARIAAAGAQAAGKSPQETKPLLDRSNRPIHRRLPPPYRIIQDYICRRFGIDRAAMISQHRGRDVVWPRFIAMQLIRTILGTSTTRIGVLFGDRDHSSVIHGISTVARRIDRDPDFAADLAGMEANVRRLLAPQSGQMSWGRYVLHGDVASYESLGWQWRARLNDHCALMIWLCECPIAEPILI